MADTNNDLDFSDNADEYESFSDEQDISDSTPSKKDLSARRRLDEIMEEKRLSKILRDEFDYW